MCKAKKLASTHYDDIQIDIYIYIDSDFYFKLRQDAGEVITEMTVIFNEKLRIFIKIEERNFICS